MVIMLSGFPDNIVYIIGVEDKIQAEEIEQNVLRLTIEVNMKETVLYKYISGKWITREKVVLLKK